MCIIIDATSLHKCVNNDKDALPVLEWLLCGKKSGLIIGGKNADEILVGRFVKIALELKRAGRLHRISNEKISEMEQKILDNDICRSNDRHVVALVLASKCPLVFTEDRALHGDLKSIPGRKIAIYQNASHRHLLTECRCSDS